MVLKGFVINTFVPLKINKEIPVTLELKELASAHSIAALFHDPKVQIVGQQGGGVMGGLRRKRALLKKVTSFNLYADQWAQIQAIMEGMRAQKEAPVLRELLDEALAARRRKFGRQEQEEQSATLNLEDVLETIRMIATQLLRESKTCLRVDGVNLGLLQETLAEARAGRKCVWERLVVPSLRERGYSTEEISNLFDEDTARAEDFAYALAGEIRDRVTKNEKPLSDANVSQEVRAAE